MRTTRQALEVMPYEIQNNPTDILVIQFGMNVGSTASQSAFPKILRWAISEWGNGLQRRFNRSIIIV